jgi:periplasmic protein TonB
MERIGTERRGELFAASLLLHGAALSLLLVPRWTATHPLPPERGSLGVLLYAPPPPPAAALPIGLVSAERVTSVPARTAPTVPSFAAPVEETTPEPVVSTEPEAADLPAGSPKGDALGVESGIETGQRDGVVGGSPDGVRGGAIGGIGTTPVPVARYDHGPRLLRMVQPEYPAEAFAKKVQGVVNVEIVVDASGRVARTKVTRSVPLLDEAALAAVRQWVFAPAVLEGRPVATLANAPVEFRLY